MISLLLISCDFDTLLEPDWNSSISDFFEEYTNTAEIEKHTISVDQYLDSAGNYTINSDQDCVLTFYLRNPQKYDLKLGCSFPSLSGVDTSSVSVVQSEYDVIKLTLPQSFLVAADEGHNIRHTISLTESKSGRSFESYSVNIMCNSYPPELNNATVLNDGNSSFVLAFDMPSQVETELRHTDLSVLKINGETYTLSVDSEGEFTFDNSRFSRSWKDSYEIINEKTFTHSSRSVYFDTQEVFTADDKEYSMVLSDKAGFSSSNLASTKITRLNTPLFKNNNEDEIQSGSDVVLVYNAGQEYTSVFMEQPEKDHLGNDVNGTNINYKLYNGTGTVSSLYEKASVKGTKELKLPAGTWYLEAYASKTNYEKSLLVSINFRVVDTVLYVSENGNDSTADGTYGLPFKTVQAAFDDINARNDSSLSYVLYVMGNINQNITVDNDLKIKALTIRGYTGPESDSINLLTMENENIPVTVENLSVNGSEEVGIEYNASNLVLSGSSKVKLPIKIPANTAGTALARTVELTSSFSGSAIITPGKYEEGIVVLKAEEGYALTQEICYLFTITEDTENNKYYVLAVNEDGSQASLSLPGINTNLGSGEYTLSPDSSFFSTSLVSAGDALFTWSVKTENSTISSSEISSGIVPSTSVELYSNGTLIASNTSSNGKTASLNIPNWLCNGTYNIKMEATVGSYTYTEYVSIEIEKLYITISETEYGTVETDYLECDEGTTVTVTLWPDTGYSLESVDIMDLEGNNITKTTVTEGYKYTFVMPGVPVVLTVKFKQT